jgi:NADPH-dependent 2,4-dienoyl-CoA reductase/sulfur reductase-like enzyme
MSAESIPVAVVGAGPYGLSVSAHLTARGVDHRVFGHPMSLWAERMPRGMYLKSEGHATNISDPAGVSTLRRYSVEEDLPYLDVGRPIPIDTFIGYGHWFRHRHVPHLEQLDVTTLTATTTGFLVELSDGSAVSAQRVVLATGVGAFDHVPSILSALPPDLASHSSQHVDLGRLAGRDVVVLGAGQGALETAALLQETGARPRVLVRAERVRWNINPAGRSLPRRVRHPVSTIGTSWGLKFCADLPSVFRYLPEERRAHIVHSTLGPSGGWWLRERVEGVVPVTVASRITAARAVGDAVELTVQGPEGTHNLTADHVIAGTGYRVDLKRLAFLDADLRDRVTTFAGYPVLDQRFQSSVPGLHFVGLTAAVSFGPVQRFVAGAGFAARRVASAMPRGSWRPQGLETAVAP